MNTRTLFVVGGLLAVSAAWGTEPAVTPAVATPAPAPALDAALPAMNFYSSIADDELFDIVKTNAAFAKLDKELIGSPITLRIRHSLQPTATGKATGLLSAIWTGGTLGLLPAITNNSFVVTYEVRVQGRDVATWSYQRNFTRAVNIWAKDETYGLGKEGFEWMKTTAAEFAAAAAHDSRLVDLKREYEQYFGTTP